MEKMTGRKSIETRGVYSDSLTTQINIRQLQGTICFPLVVFSMQLLDLLLMWPLCLLESQQISLFERPVTDWSTMPPAWNAPA